MRNGTFFGFLRLNHRGDFDEKNDIGFRHGDTFIKWLC